MKSIIVYVYVPAIGDFVHCNWCENIMLLPHGADKCPICEEAGYFAWQEGDDIERLHELTREEIEALGYQTQRCPDLKDNECFEEIFMKEQL